MFWVVETDVPEARTDAMRGEARRGGRGRACDWDTIKAEWSYGPMRQMYFRMRETNERLAATQTSETTESAGLTGLTGDV